VAKHIGAVVTRRRRGRSQDESAYRRVLDCAVAYAYAARQHPEIPYGAHERLVKAIRAYGRASANHARGAVVRR
jgi:hypothetical protein